MNMYMRVKLDEILEKAYNEISLTRKEIIFLLKLQQTEEISQVFSTARKLRRRHFGDKIFLYGLLCLFTFCQNNSTFYLYRRSNQLLHRSRKSEAQILESASSLAESGVHLLDLTMGEDPEYVLNEQDIVKLLKIIEMVKKETGLPLMVSPGVVPGNILKEFKKSGVNWYACNQDTHIPKLYYNLRIDQEYVKRLERKIIAKKLGLLIEEGILTGVRDTVEETANSLIALESLGAEQVRVMSFIHQEATPLENWKIPSRLREMLIIAVMRLLFPDRLIPVALDVDGINGLKQRMDAGANVVTSIMPPKVRFAGISSEPSDFEEGNRTVEQVVMVMKELGLTPASLEQYTDWICKNNGG